MKGKRNIVWIASYLKSGNTWFRAFLSNFLSDSVKPKNINDLDVSGIASSRILFDQLAAVSSSDLTNSEINNLRPYIYRQLSNQSDDTIYMKVHDAWIKNENGEALFPKDVTRCAIYIIRHPLDVAVSLSFHNSSHISNTLSKLNDKSYGLCDQQNRLSNQLPQSLLSWSDHVKSWTQQSGLKIHLIKYEQMLDNPHKTFTKVLDFLELSYTKERLNRAILNSSFVELKNQEEVLGFREKPLNASTFFRKGIKSDWKNYIDKHSAKLFLSSNKEILNQYYFMDYDIK